MSLSTASSVSLLLRMSERNRACPGGSDESSNRPARPMMACTGVRTSWLTVASRLALRGRADLGDFLGPAQLAPALRWSGGLRPLEPLLFEQPFARALEHAPAVARHRAAIRAAGTGRCRPRRPRPRSGSPCRRRPVRSTGPSPTRPNSPVAQNASASARK